MVVRKVIPVQNIKAPQNETSRPSHFVLRSIVGQRCDRSYQWRVKVVGRECISIELEQGRTRG